MVAERKPLAPAESRVARSIRTSDAEWAPFVTAGRLRDKEPSTIFRECALIGLHVIETPELIEGYARVTSALVATYAATHASYTAKKPA
jgi:hypothetical protein